MWKLSGDPNHREVFCLRYAKVEGLRLAYSIPLPRLLLVWGQAQNKWLISPRSET